MEDKYREIFEQLLYHVSVDIYDLLEEDSGDIVEAITDLSQKVERLSDDVMYKDQLVYKRTGCVDLTWDLR
jgi:hypothetical protein